MKRLNIYSIALLTFFLAFSLAASAQLDSRNRTVETIVADNLAQLPAQNADTYNQIVSELAGTGSKGVEQIAGMLTNAATGKNATFEYALNGIADYVNAPGNANLKESVREGLVNSLEKCTDNVNKAFLITLIQKFATKDNLSVFTKYLSDDYLKGYAVRAIEATPDIDNAIIDMVMNGGLDEASLADIVAFKNIRNEEVENVLISWLKGSNDATTQRSIYHALGKIGTIASLKELKASGAEDDYLSLLNNLSSSNNKKVQKALSKEIKVLQNSGKDYLRIAALELLFKSDKKNLTDNILSALKDGSRQYRTAALEYAKIYAGSNIFSAVANQMSTLSDASKQDVVSWLGSNHRTDQVDVVIGAMNSSDTDLANAAILAAGKIGGRKALNALTSKLNGNNIHYVDSALLAFNGNIEDGIIAALNGDVATQAAALQLASARKMYKAYDKVTSLLNSFDANVKSAAYDALAGVVQPSNFAALCTMLESDQNTAKIQQAALNAIKTLSGDEQYNLINSQLAKTSKADLYYPLLGQAGNSAAIEKLLSAYNSGSNKAEALKSLLTVNNPEMIDILYSLAAKESASNKDNILNRYLALVKASDKNNIQKFQLLSDALNLKPSIAVQNALVENLGTTKNFPALMAVSKFLDGASKLHAASAVMSLMNNKEVNLLGGPVAKSVLKKAQDVYRAQTDADSGYAIDQINGLLEKCTDNGFAPVDVMDAAYKKPFKSAKSYENFEMYIDWKSDDAATVSVRSMPEVTLNSTEVAFNFSEAKGVAKKGEWNNLYIKVLNDRIFVFSNGEKVVENAIMKNTPENKSINAKGLIEITAGKNGSVMLRNLYINELPSTPVYILPEEEKKAGFEVLFDGRSLEKWHGNTTAYVPVDGNIYVTANYGGTGNLYTNKKYSDFVYRFEFCFGVEGVNNGIGIRTKEGADAAYEGMEIQVLDHDAPIYADLQPYQQHGSVYGIIVPKHIDFGPIGTWHKEEIKAVGDHITVTVDGVVVTDGDIRQACQGHNVAPDGADVNPYTVDHKNHPGLFNKDGYISFCGHGAGVMFRNVRILDLSKKK